MQKILEPLLRRLRFAPGMVPDPAGTRRVPTGMLRDPARMLRDKSILVLPTLSAIKFLLHLLSSEQFGYFRDEFYYIAASKHLDLGYVDFPPFIAIVTRLVRATLGESLLALHLLPALAGAILVFLTGRMAQQLGAGPFGQGLAALATLVAPQFLGANSILSMDSFDMLFWGFALYLLILIFHDEQPKKWLWFGLVVGLGLTNKVSLLYFSLALVIALALTRQRSTFRSLWLYAGGAIAIAFLVPYLIWNAMHGWPTVEFWEAYGNKVYQAAPLEFLLQQILIMHPFTFPLWVMGLIYFFSKRGITYRPFGWMYVVLFLIFMLQHAKNYFLAPIYPILFAAGALVFELAVEINPRRAWLKSAYVLLLAIGGIVIAPLAVPVLPLPATVRYVRSLSGTNVKSEKFETGVLPQHFADRFGWEELAATTAKVYHSLPATDQANACIFTGNYGEAGALEFYGPQYGLPQVISGHNNYYIWGPDGCSGETVILIGAGDLEDLRQVFSDVQEVSRTQCEYCMPYENHLPIYVAHGLKTSLEQLWPGVKNFQ
ncbi:MAG TPA: glycosyltransferase family 39 protein [Anaerolineales bacterium]|nr:glycosyltransferase family 39 protein [Anaerolineales bacterium]